MNFILLTFTRFVSIVTTNLLQEISNARQNLAITMTCTNVFCVVYLFASFYLFTFYISPWNIFLPLYLKPYFFNKMIKEQIILIPRKMIVTV